MMITISGELPEGEFADLHERLSRALDILNREVADIEWDGEVEP